MFMVVYYLKDEVTIRAAAVAGKDVVEMMDNLCLDDPEVTSVDQIVALKLSADESKLDGLKVKRLKSRGVGHLSVVVESFGSVYEGHNMKEAMEAYIEWGMKARGGKDGKGKDPAKGKKVYLVENGVTMQYWEPKAKH